jgi:CheY-like chemotaxis protein
LNVGNNPEIDNTPIFRIMIVDDNNDITTTYTHHLQDQSEFKFKVESYNSPYEALQKFRESPEETYDVLLIDINMPGMDGLGLYKEIQKSNKKVPKILFVTAYEAFHNLLKQSYPEMGENNFIRKPITQRDLLTKLKQELQKID